MLAPGPLLGAWLDRTPHRRTAFVTNQLVLPVVLVVLLLETGHAHEPAWHVYERGGFTRCGPVLDYPDTGWSVFYEKLL